MIGQDQNEFEPTQREKFFQTRCQINKWVCSLIIDGGSSTNVSSISLVKKVGLETIPHAKTLQTCLHKYRWRNRFQ